jgi:hypothetical protein
MMMIWESAIRAGDFAGVVPASRGAHCRPLHPWLASLCFLGKKGITEPRVYRRPGLGRSRELHISMFQLLMIINLWRTFRGGVAVI